MASIGEKLRQARLESGLALAELSVRTKISVKFLEAIEAGRREELPGGFFFRNWVGQYARALGLDEAAALAEAGRIISADEPLALPGLDRLGSRSVPAMPVRGGRRRRGQKIENSLLFLAMVVLGCSGLFSWWHKTTQVQASAAPLSAPAQATRTPALAVNQPVDVQTPQAPADPLPALAPVSIASIPAAEPRPQGPVTVELTASEPAWMSISRDGKPVFSGVLDAGQSKALAAQDSLRIRVGNAGGLTVRFDGKSMGGIGPRGQVRTLLFNREGFQVVSNGGGALSAPLDQQ